jgi:ferredoxin, 2Fe-2S
LVTKSNEFAGFCPEQTDTVNVLRSEQEPILGVIQVIDTNNVSHILEAIEGWRVMEIIREHGFEVGGLCGGACACATCHVEVHAEWADKLHPANDDEEAMLDEVPALSATSRLSCQIIYTEDLDGLAVKLVSNG